MECTFFFCCIRFRVNECMEVIGRCERIAARQRVGISVRDIIIYGIEQKPLTVHCLAETYSIRSDEG